MLQTIKVAKEWKGIKEGRKARLKAWSECGMRMILCLRDHAVPFIHFPPLLNFLGYALVNVHMWLAWSPVLSLCDTRSVIVTCYRRSMLPQLPRGVMCNDMPAKICLTVLPCCLRRIQEPEDSGASISDCLPRRGCSLGCGRPCFGDSETPCSVHLLPA